MVNPFDLKTIVSAQAPTTCRVRGIGSGSYWNLRNMSYSVAQGTREIGVRMAVGANRTNVLRLVLSQAGRFTAVGIIVGLAAGFACARLISGLLFNTSTVDPLSLWIAIGALVLAAALAVIIPASRAASVNPNEALRAE